MSMNKVTINDLHRLLEWEVSDADMYGLVEWLNNNGHLAVVGEKYLGMDEVINKDELSFKYTVDTLNMLSEQKNG